MHNLNEELMPDLQWRFALMCLAALEAPLQLTLEGSLYGSDMVFIANDWQASLTAVYLAGKYRPYGTYQDARCIMAIHNLRHQVGCPAGSWPFLAVIVQHYGS